MGGQAAAAHPLHGGGTLIASQTERREIRGLVGDGLKRPCRTPGEKTDARHAEPALPIVDQGGRHGEGESVTLEIPEARPASWLDLPSTSILGSSRPSQRGNHQLRSPSNSMGAGTWPNIVPEKAALTSVPVK